MNIMDEARAKLRQQQADQATTLSSKPSASKTSNNQVRIVPDLVCMADVAPEEIKWLWPRRLALGKLSLLAGKAGLGKSFLTCDIATRISRGWKWPCSEDLAPLGDVLLISGEDDPSDTIRPRLDALEADVKRVHVLKAATLIEANGKESSIAFDLSHVDLIRDSLDKLPACKLVVIDPIGSYLGDKVDAHRENEVRSVLAPLGILAAERGVSILLVAHPPKFVSGNADDNVLGSRAFTGIVRSVFHLVSDTDNKQRRLLLAGKTNIGAMAPGLAFHIEGYRNHAWVEWEAEPLEGMYADDAMKPNGSRGPKADKLNQAIDWLRTLLADGPKHQNEIVTEAEKAGYSRATIRRAKDQLGINPQKREFSGRWEWALPQGAQVPLEDAQLTRRCSSNEKLEHLRENPEKNPEKNEANAEGAQVSKNLSTFGDSSNNLSTFGEDQEWTC